MRGYFKRKKLALIKRERTMVTLQDLADFVDLCARADLDPKAPISVCLRGERLSAFELIAEGDVVDTGSLRAVA